MIKKIIALFVLLITPLVSDAAPEGVTLSSGTLSQGETITITGSGFGTGPTIYKWDDFEGSTHNVGYGIGAGPGSIAWGANNPTADDEYKPQVTSGGKTNSTKYITVAPTGSSSVRGFHFDYGNTLSPLFVTYWFRWDGNITASNTKPLDPANPICDYECALGGTYYYSGPGVGITWQLDTNDFVRIANDDVGDTCSHSYDADDGITGMTRASTDQWVRGDFFGIESSAATEDGTVIWDMQLSSGATFTSLVAFSGNVNTRVDSDEHWRGSVFGRYTGGTTSGYDDIYIANSRARVELGDNATWANCTHREIQIPTAWAAGEITATVNTGSFEGGTAYLFVVDEDGNVSSGYEVTISTPSLRGVSLHGVDMR